MPWIKKETCTGCAICIEECPADAISMEDDKAVINEQKCIRCGICHTICPAGASRHDSERVPAEVAAKLAWARGLLEHKYYAERPELRDGLRERLRRNMKKDIQVLDQAIQLLGDL